MEKAWLVGSVPESQGLLPGWNEIISETGINYSVTHSHIWSKSPPPFLCVLSLSTRTLQHGRFMVARFLYGKKGGHQILSDIKVIFWSLWFLYHFWTWLVTRQETEVLFTRTPYRLNTLEWLSSHSCGVFSLGLMLCMVPCCTTPLSHSPASSDPIWPLHFLLLQDSKATLASIMSLAICSSLGCTLNPNRHAWVGGLLLA